MLVGQSMIRVNLISPLLFLFVLFLSCLSMTYGGGKQHNAKHHTKLPLIDNFFNKTEIFDYRETNLLDTCVPVQFKLTAIKYGAR